AILKSNDNRPPTARIKSGCVLTTSRASRSLQSICMDGDFVIRFRRDTSGGGDDGREGYFGKEVCCAAERRGTRATRSVDTQGQERRAAAAEGSDIVEGRRVGSR